MPIRCSVLVIALASLLPLAAATATHVERPMGTTASPYGYVEYLPAAYSTDTSRTFPLLIFLHGLGEKGNGAAPMGPLTRNGPHKMIKAGSTLFNDAGVVVCSPQTPVWWNTGTLTTYLDYLTTTYRIDRSRIWVTGLSMGGGGTFDWVRDRPELFAACIPICAASGTVLGNRLVDVPTWAFHAWGDPTVNRGTSINWCNAIATARAGAGTPSCLANYPHLDNDTTKPASSTRTAAFGSGGWTWREGRVATNDSQPQLTLYTNNSHDSWSATYGDPAVWRWLFAQRQIRTQLQILSPTHGSTLPEDQALTLSASAIDADGKDIPGNRLRWSSSLDGALGSGTSLAVSHLTAGRHRLEVATDDGRSRSAVTVEVAFTGRRRWRIDCGSQAQASTAPIANLTNKDTGSALNLNDLDGQASTLDIAVTDGFVGINENGLAVDGVLPASVQRDNFYVQSGGDATGAVTISDLDRSLAYTVICFASRSADDGRTTVYQIGSHQRELVVANNTDHAAVFRRLRPDSGGRLVVRVGIATGSPFGYLGGLEIQAHSVNARTVKVRSERLGILEPWAPETEAATWTLVSDWYESSPLVSSEPLQIDWSPTGPG